TGTRDVAGRGQVGGDGPDVAARILNEAGRQVVELPAALREALAGGGAARGGLVGEHGTDAGAPTSAELVEGLASGHAVLADAALAVDSKARPARHLFSHRIAAAALAVLVVGTLGGATGGVGRGTRFPAFEALHGRR